MKNCKGNALVYILLAVGLLAALTFAISGDNRGSQQNQLSASQADLIATDLMNHATAAEQAVMLMTQWGNDYSDLRFDLPGTGPYSSNTSQQIYHPSGGGLGVFQTNANMFDGNGTTGWAFQGNVDIDWTDNNDPTTGTDLIYTFINVATPICESINERAVGNTTIPTTTVDFTNTFTESATDDDFIASECAACQGVKSLCINDGTTNAFYTIIGAR